MAEYQQPRLTVPFTGIPFNPSTPPRSPDTRHRLETFIPQKHIDTYNQKHPLLPIDHTNIRVVEELVQDAFVSSTGGTDTHLYEGCSQYTTDPNIALQQVPENSFCNVIFDKLRSHLTGDLATSDAHQYLCQQCLLPHPQSAPTHSVPIESETIQSVFQSKEHSVSFPTSTAYISIPQHKPENPSTMLYVSPQSQNIATFSSLDNTALIDAKQLGEGLHTTTSVRDFTTSVNSLMDCSSTHVSLTPLENGNTALNAHTILNSDSHNGGSHRVLVFHKTREDKYQLHDSWLSSTESLELCPGDRYVVLTGNVADRRLDRIFSKLVKTSDHQAATLLTEGSNSSGIAIVGTITPALKQKQTSTSHHHAPSPHSSTSGASFNPPGHHHTTSSSQSRYTSGYNSSSLRHTSPLPVPQDIESSSHIPETPHEIKSSHHLPSPSPALLHRYYQNSSNPASPSFHHGYTQPIPVSPPDTTATPRSNLTRLVPTTELPQSGPYSAGATNRRNAISSDQKHPAPYGTRNYTSNTPPSRPREPQYQPPSTRDLVDNCVSSEFRVGWYNKEGKFERREACWVKDPFGIDPPEWDTGRQIEDTHLVTTCSGGTLIVVCDGHEGESVSQFTRDRLPQILEEKINQAQQVEAAVFDETFQELDDQYFGTLEHTIRERRDIEEQLNRRSMRIKSDLNNTLFSDKPVHRIEESVLELQTYDKKVHPLTVTHATKNKSYHMVEFQITHPTGTKHKLIIQRNGEIFLDGRKQTYLPQLLPTQDGLCNLEEKVDARDYFQEGWVKAEPLFAETPDHLSFRNCSLVHYDNDSKVPTHYTLTNTHWDRTVVSARLTARRPDGKTHTVTIKRDGVVTLDDQPVKNIRRFAPVTCSSYFAGHNNNLDISRPLPKLDQKLSGGTAVAVAFIKDGTLHTANAGDCRVIIVSKRPGADKLTPIQVTRDHSLSTSGELERARRAGMSPEQEATWITAGRGGQGRLSGQENTHSLGDWSYKFNYKSIESFKDFSEPPLINTPYVNSLKLTQEHQYMISCSDGAYSLAHIFKPELTENEALLAFIEEEKRNDPNPLTLPSRVISTLKRLADEKAAYEYREGKLYGSSTAKIDDITLVITPLRT